MSTQLLNAEAQVITIQYLLGHNGFNTTERYCSVSNLNVMRGYFKAMEVIMERTSRGHPTYFLNLIEFYQILLENGEVGLAIIRST